MANSGVESLRMVIDWRSLEPARGKFTLGGLDRLTRIASTHHLRLFINMSASPQWASSAPGTQEFWRAPPKDPGDYAMLMSTLVGRVRAQGRVLEPEPHRAEDAHPPVAGLERAHRPVVLVSQAVRAELRQALARDLQGHAPRRSGGERRHRRTGDGATLAVADGQRPLPRRARREPSTSWPSTRSPTTTARRRTRSSGRSRSSGGSAPSCAATTTLRRRIALTEVDVAGRGRPRPGRRDQRARDDLPRPGRPAERRLARARAEAPEARPQPGLLVHVGVGVRPLDAPEPFRYAGLVKRDRHGVHPDARAHDVQHRGGPLRGLPQVGRQRLALPLTADRCSRCR